jgi:hypothetical protein
MSRLRGAQLSYHHDRILVTKSALIIKTGNIPKCVRVGLKVQEQWARVAQTQWWWWYTYYPILP